jgi:hypothetical protein
MVAPTNENQRGDTAQRAARDSRIEHYQRMMLLRQLDAAFPNGFDHGSHGNDSVLQTTPIPHEGNFSPRGRVAVVTSLVRDDHHSMGGGRPEWNLYEVIVMLKGALALSIQAPLDASSATATAAAAPSLVPELDEPPSPEPPDVL